MVCPFLITKVKYVGVFHGCQCPLQSVECVVSTIYHHQNLLLLMLNVLCVCYSSDSLSKSKSNHYLSFRFLYNFSKFLLVIFHNLSSWYINTLTFPPKSINCIKLIVRISEKKVDIELKRLDYYYDTTD